MERTWVGMLREEQDYYSDMLRELDRLYKACQKLDEVGIPPEGSIYRDSITIRKATEDYVPKLVKIKTAPVVKYFYEWSGELGYSTEIGGTSIFVVPDVDKYICKVTKNVKTTIVPREEKTTKFHLDEDCDPLFFEEATKEEVVG